jgi:hypothetical protein
MDSGWVLLASLATRSPSTVARVLSVTPMTFSRRAVRRSITGSLKRLSAYGK